MKRLFAAVLFIPILMVYQNLCAQENYLAPISIKDFNSNTTIIIDSTAHAVVLFEKGHSLIQVNDRENALCVIHNYAVRIKILDKEGFDEANHVIPLYKFGNTFETVSLVKGFTHHLENNRIQTTEMEREAVFHEKVNEFVNLTKFTLPNIRENCIIDIQYQIQSPDIFNYRTWDFQSEIPKIHSEYTAVIPANYEYNVTLRGPYKLDDQKSSVLREYFLLNGRRFDCSQLTYIMKEIPAFKEESFMLAPKNFKSAVYFELMQYYHTNGSKQVLTKEWKDVDRELLSDRSFGGQINREQNFKNILPAILADSDSKEQKARKIYDYIKRQIRWNRAYGKYAQHGVKDALERRSGNVGDINLALISALNAAGLDAYPVLISTRENGLPNNLHPVISNFNYLIAQVRIDDQTYFLDASEQNLPFGLLPLRCINGNGRIIYSKKSSEWIPLENQVEARKQFNIKGEVDENGLFTGQLTINYVGLDAFNKRNHIRSFSSIDDYLENMMDRTTNMQITDGRVENLDSLENNLMEHLDFTIDLSSYIRGNHLSFNPFIINRLNKNPFNLEERTYPVDLGSKQHEVYYLNIHLPNGYSLSNSPKNTSMALPEATARYTFQSQFENNLLSLRQVLSLNKPIYEVDEYFHLKEFFSRIIQQQKIDFTFQKQ